MRSETDSCVSYDFRISVGEGVTSWANSWDASANWRLRTDRVNTKKLNAGQCPDYGGADLHSDVW